MRIFESALVARERESESHSVVSNSLWPHGLYSSWNSPGQNTGLGKLSLLQGNLTNPGLLHCRWILYQLSHKGNPLVAYTVFKLKKLSIIYICICIYLSVFNFCLIPKGFKQGKTMKSCKFLKDEDKVIRIKIMERNYNNINACHKVLKLLRVGLHLTPDLWRTTQKYHRNVSLWFGSIPVNQQELIALGNEASVVFIF